MPLTSAPAIAAARAGETGEVFLVLATFTHDSLTSPIRVANNTEDITSNGNLFKGIPFGFQLISDDDRQPRGLIEVQNVGGIDRAASDDSDAPPVTPRISEIILPLNGPINAEFQIVLASSPDTVEETYSDLVLRDVQADAISVRATITSRFWQSEPATRYRVTEQLIPGAYV